MFTSYFFPLASPKSTRFLNCIFHYKLRYETFRTKWDDKKSLVLLLFFPTTFYKERKYSVWAMWIIFALLNYRKTEYYLCDSVVTPEITWKSATIHWILFLRRAGSGELFWIYVPHVKLVLTLSDSSMSFRYGSLNSILNAPGKRL